MLGLLRQCKEDDHALQSTCKTMLGRRDWSGKGTAEQVGVHMTEVGGTDTITDITKRDGDWDTSISCTLSPDCEEGTAYSVMR